MGSLGGQAERLVLLMSYWIEVHCDVRSTTSNPAKSRLNNANVCWELRNDNPSAMVLDVVTASRVAVSEARRQGYVRRVMTMDDGYRFMGWVCPHCQKFPPGASDEVS